MSKEIILVAEDDIDDRYLLEMAFQEVGGKEKLFFVDNGIELFNYLNAASNNDNIVSYPDLVILDLNMPKKNGREALTEIKQHPLYKHIPVIVYTTTRNENEVKTCYDLGADKYFVKPINFESLLGIVRSMRSYLNTVQIHEY